MAFQIIVISESRNLLCRFSSSFYQNASSWKLKVEHFRRNLPCLQWQGTNCKWTSTHCPFIIKHILSFILYNNVIFNIVNVCEASLSVLLSLELYIQLSRKYLIIFFSSILISTFSTATPFFCNGSFMWGGLLSWMMSLVAKVEIVK